MRRFYWKVEAGAEYAFLVSGLDTVADVTFVTLADGEDGTERVLAAVRAADGARALAGQ